jgi:hypothetical protein
LELSDSLRIVSLSKIFGESRGGVVFWKIVCNKTRRSGKVQEVIRPRSRCSGYQEVIRKKYYSDQPVLWTAK